MSTLYRWLNADSTPNTLAAFVLFAIVATPAYALAIAVAVFCSHAA